MSNQLQPGDIWRHPTMGRLYVTDEDRGAYPGMLKCYWSMGGNPNAPFSFRHPSNTTNLTLESRLGVQDANGKWRIDK